MQKNSSIVFLFCCLLIAFNLSAQNDSLKKEGVDVYDLVGNISHHFDSHHIDSVKTRSGKFHFPILPVFGYSLSTGFVGGIATSIAFYTSENKLANISNVLGQFLYTQNNQMIFSLQPNIWTRNNKYLFKADYVYLNYPTQTFGLGNRSTDNDINYIDYSHLRIYQSFLKQIAPSFYAGLGYNLDYHWDITQTGSVDQKAKSTFSNYGYTSKSVSSGMTLNFLYDNRLNSINPKNGFYFNAVFKQNAKYFGSDQNWQSLLLDIRKYYTLPGKARNVLAFWSYNNFTFNGKPPYLDLPGTGLDEFGNTGRGYIQGRYRGKNMIDLESEFRFGITRNGFLGGVLFANAQSFNTKFVSISNNLIPAAGFGIRMKIHKHTDTNLCLDYAFGSNGSNGLFLNLNEVF